MKILSALLPKGKWGYVIVAAALLFAVRGIDAFRGNGNEAVPTAVVGSAPAFTLEPTIRITTTSSEGQGVAVDSFPTFEADIQADGGMYWPHTEESEYQPGLDKGLAIYCYLNQASAVESQESRFLNGMPVGFACQFYRVVAYSFGADHIVAISVMRPLPGPGEVP